MRKQKNIPIFLHHFILKIEYGIVGFNNMMSIYQYYDVTGSLQISILLSKKNTFSNLSNSKILLQNYNKTLTCDKVFLNIYFRNALEISMKRFK